MSSTTKEVVGGNGEAKTQSGFAEQGAEWREKAKDLGRDAQALGKITQHMASGAVDVVREHAGTYYEDGVKHAKSLEENFEKQVRARPTQSLLIAAGVGLLLGMVLRK